MAASAPSSNAWAASTRRCRWWSTGARTSTYPRSWSHWRSRSSMRRCAMPRSTRIPPRSAWPSTSATAPSSSRCETTGCRPPAGNGVADPGWACGLLPSRPSSGAECSSTAGRRTDGEFAWCCRAAERIRKAQRARRGRSRRGAVGIPAAARASAVGRRLRGRVDPRGGRRDRRRRPARCRAGRSLPRRAIRRGALRGPARGFAEDTRAADLRRRLDLARGRQGRWCGRLHLQGLERGRGRQRRPDRRQGHDRLRATGDGGRASTAQNNAQLLGKILRIDPTDSGYTVPAENPFVDGAGRDEIWSYGVRNPRGISFDRVMRTIAIADAGNDRYEEVNYTKLAESRGANFGWPAFEAFAPLRGGVAPGHTVLPAYAYRHHPGCAVAGGFVVRDSHLARIRGREIYGDYVLGDYCTGNVYGFRPRAGRRAGKQRTFRFGTRYLTSIGRDDSGRIYLLTERGPSHKGKPSLGSVYRLVPHRKPLPQ